MEMGESNLPLPSSIQTVSDWVLTSLNSREASKWQERRMETEALSSQRLQSEIQKTKRKFDAISSQPLI